MKKATTTMALALTVPLLLSGCETWSTSSVSPTAGAPTPSLGASTPSTGATSAVAPDASILITENDISDRPYTPLGDIKVTVRKTTIFNKDPTHEDIDARLRARARALGADAVVLVRYGTVGIGMTSWGVLNGEGRAVKFR